MKICEENWLNIGKVCAHCLRCSKEVSCKDTELLCKVMFAQKKRKGKTKEGRSCVDAFELLLPSENRRKWNVSKTYLRKKKIGVPFQDAGTKEMIIQWLFNTQNKFERLTQSQEIYDFCEDDNNYFSLPSVSQNKSTKREYINLRSRKVKRPHSLDLKRVKGPNKVSVKGASLSFNTSCNYNIEEFDTGPIVGADMENALVQKNIIQQLEDDFLDSIESEVDITKYNSKINNCDSNVLSSGWDRMKQMKKSVCKSNKRAKKLKTVQINASLQINDVETDGVRILRSRDKNKKNIKKSDVPNAKINERTAFLDREVISNRNIVVDCSKNCNNNATFHETVLKIKNLDVEIIDLTVDSQKEESTAKNVERNCEIIIRNIAEINTNERGKGKCKNPALKTTKTKLSLNLPLDTTQEQDVSSLDTLKMSNDYNNGILQQRGGEENVIFLIDTQKININDHNLNNNICKDNLNGIVDVPLINQHFNNVETQNAAIIPLELDKIRKLIQNCTDYDLELKKILLCKLNDLLQLLEINVCVDNSKMRQSVGIQTIQVSLQHAFVQTSCAMENIEVQTDFLQGLVKSTQTSKSAKCLQSDEIKLDVQVQVDENDFRTSPQEKIINSIVEKYLASQECVQNKKCNSQSTARRIVNFDSCNSQSTARRIDSSENISPSEKRTKSRQTELDIKNIVWNNVERTPKEHDLNVAILLTESEKAFSQPNSPANQTQNSAQVESIGVISQTQPNIFLNKIPRPKATVKKSPSSARMESIGIVSQTQINRSPMNFLAKLAAMPEKDSPPRNKTVEFSDSFERLVFNTGDILADGEVSCYKKSPSVVITPSNIQISVDKVPRKLDFDVKRMKRIRFLDDTDSDEDQPKTKKRLTNRFVRDDLSIEFQTGGNVNSDDNLLPDDLPAICDHDLDFNLEDCLRNIERKFDPNSSGPESLKNPREKPIITTKFVREKDNLSIDRILDIRSTKTILFKSPKRPKRSILSEIICPNESPAKVTILDNIIIEAPVKKCENDIDLLDEVICSDESSDENTKLRIVAADDIWGTPKKRGFLNIPSLTATPDMFNVPSEGEEVFLAPPPEFANSDHSADNRPNVVTLQDNPINISIPEAVPNYDILSLSPIKPPADKATNNFAFSIKKLDKPRAKPLNISHHSTPKVKQNTIYSYLKRTQNRTYLNTSSSSLCQQTDDLMTENSLNGSQTIAEKSENRKLIPCIACSRLNKDDVIAVTSLVRKKLISFKNSFDKFVTHMIVSVNKDNMVKDHTMKYILAISAGIWILNAEWIKECVKNNDIVEERPFEVLDVFGFPGPKDSRIYREIKPLLAEFRIFASPPFRTTEKSVIEDVVRNMGGTVVDDPIQFLNKGSAIDLVITEASSTQSFLVDDDWLNVYQVATVDIEWLSRSVGQFKVLSFLPFLLCDADEIQNLNVYPENYLDNIPGFTFSTQRETES